MSQAMLPEDGTCLQQSALLSIQLTTLPPPQSANRRSDLESAVVLLQVTLLHLSHLSKMGASNRINHIIPS